MALKKKKAPGPFLFVFICLVLVTASIYLLSQWENLVNKGLDLEGGVYVLLEAVETEGDEESRDAIQRAMTIIDNRINELGIAEPVIMREGERRIRVELPGVEDQARAMELIGRTAQLVFKSPEGEVLLTGAHLKTAYFSRDHLNRPIVALEFDEEGTSLFAEATERYLRDHIAIYLDDELVSAPTVQNVINEGKAVITNIPSEEEAYNIALMLRTGALPVELVELETRSVGPILGENALGLSITAGMLGLLLVFLFMLFYYRFAGLVAGISLIVYLALVFAVLGALEATLTLPGIAGLILSIGMAVDANVIIYERIKEELKAGRTIFTSVNAGFERALRAIIDANITTAIAALVLFLVTSGTIKGFALVLLIGIVASIITAVLLTRYLLRLAARSKLIKSPAYLGLRRS